jgi:hypothetical protein
MQGNARSLSACWLTRAAGLAKLVVLALVLAVVFSAGRIAMALLVVDGTHDRTAQDAEVTQLAYRYATSEALSTGTPEPDPL